MHFKHPIQAGILAGLGWLVSGCAGSISSAVDAYDQGRYPEALQTLRQLERSRGPELAHDARYTLYRGLSELALGNAHRAYLWLSATKEALAHNLEALDPHDQARLAAAWRSLGKMPAQLR
jgi:hypothetical protein